MDMKDKIKNMGHIFNTTFNLMRVIDTTLDMDVYITISKSDRKMMKAFYKVYEMKRFSDSYGAFEQMVINHSVNTNVLPVLAAEKLCLESNKNNDE